MDIDRKEAVANLRLAVKATLLVIPQHEYRVWAQLYLKQAEYLGDMGSLADRAEDSINDLLGWESWTNLGRARECWFIIRTINTALERLEKDDYHNATLYALDAAQSCLRISKASERYLLEFVQDLETSLHGEVLTTS